MPIAYHSYNVPNHIVYNTPFFQRLLSSHIPSLDDEFESRTTQEISEHDVLQMPSSAAVYNFVQNNILNVVGTLVIDEILPNVDNKSPNSTAIYNEFQKVSKLDYENNFTAVNTFQDGLKSSQDIDLFNEEKNHEVPNARSVRDFVIEVIDTQTVKYIFACESLVWDVNHGRNTDIFIERVRDKNNKTVQCTCEVINMNNVRFTFTYPTCGYVILKF